MTAHTGIIVVGGGTAGLLAAARAREVGFDVTLIESTATVGGATSTDTGRLWLPATHMASKGGRADRPDNALEYLNSVLGEPSESSTAERREAFVASSAEVARWLDDADVGLGIAKKRCDYHPDAPGSRRTGRVLTADTFDRRTLGPLRDLLRMPDQRVNIAPRSPRGLLAAAQALSSRTLNSASDRVSGGVALAGRLLHRVSKLGVTIWTSTPLTGLMVEDGRVVGVRVRRGGSDIELLAKAVILAGGGFEGNADMRREHLPLPTDASWSCGLASNDGSVILAAAEAGAKLTDMNRAWWTPVARFCGVTYRMTNERSLPHGIIVDSAGDRFMNESSASPGAAQAFYDRNRRVRAIPSYLIVDSRHRTRYRMGPWLPGSAPNANSDEIVKAQSLAELAGELSIDQAGLIGTVVRFNSFAAKGTDSDFGRGNSSAERMLGDSLSRKNPCVGGLERGPYWAVRLYPGDSGTKGGVLTDANARALNAEGDAIPGLFAVSGTAASMFTDTSPGPGAALASALVEAYRAVEALRVEQG